MHPRRPEWLLFDDHGEIWPASSLELRRRLACPNYEGDLAADLVRNLGFVAGRALGNKATVRLHVQVVSDVALAAVFYWIADQHPASVLIDFVGEQRPAELCASAEAAIARLIELTPRHDFSRHFAEKPCSLEDLSADSPLRGLLDIWTQNQGRFNAPALIDYASQHLFRRFIVIRQFAFDRLVFDILGDGLHVPDTSWFRTALGRAVEDQPDAEYWCWVAQSYRSTLRSNFPALSDIDADIYWPSEGWVRRRYRRLRLPCTAADGTRYLFSANSAESGRTLRAKVA